MAASQLPVLLGIADERCNRKLLWNQNKFGGDPDWVTPTVHPICTLCRSPSYLVVQVYCPLVGSLDHRTIYIFACPEKSCRQKSESWSVLRMQRLAEREGETTRRPDHPVMDEEWTDDADDWGSDEEVDGALQAVSNPVEESPLAASCPDAANGSVGVLGIDRLVISEGPSRTNEAAGSWFSCYHMNVFNEPESKTRVNGYEQRLLREYAQREGLPSGDASWDDFLSSDKADRGSEESYEKVLPSHGSVSFMKFTKRISRCPEQCVRYSWSGKPLLISSLPSNTSPPNCQSCGATRVFELQLMPALILLLQPQPAGDSDASLDFGTVLIYTCSRSCWSQASLVKEECVILQQDPDSGSIGHL